MNAVPHLSMFAAADLERLHDSSLRVLEEVGVRFRSARARAVLKEGGALVDEESQVVRIPRDLVEWAIATVPKTFTAGARDPGHDLVFDHTRTYVTLGGVAPGTLDHRTGERRQATNADLADAMRVSDALPEIDLLYPIVSCNDVAPELSALQAVATTFTNSGKHAQLEVFHPAEVPYLMEIARLVAGEGGWDPARPIFSHLYCPVAPLQHEADPLDAALALVAEGVPQVVFSLPLAGATAPASIAWTMVQCNCEVLSAFVAMELTAPGCPLVYVGNAAIMDMHAATYAQGGPETTLIDVGLTELGRRYGVPVLTLGFYTDAKEVSMHMGIDDEAMTLASFLARPDIVSGPGLMDAAMLLFLPKLVLDAEVRRRCDRVMAGVSLDDEHLMLDVIASVGPGGHYLKAKETARMLRSGEHLAPQLFPRLTYDAWLADGRSELDRAIERLEDILTTHEPHALPDGALDGIDDLLGRALEELPAEMQTTGA
jgi:trimethylamine--corrinoid protein Co-methyltransferase